MADTIPTDSVLAAAIVVTDEAGAITPPVDDTGTPLTQVAQQAQPDPANPTYLERLKAAGL
jgi:hypothetical protein